MVFTSKLQMIKTKNPNDQYKNLQNILWKTIITYKDINLLDCLEKKEAHLDPSPKIGNMYENVWLWSKDIKPLSLNEKWFLGL